MLGSLEHSKYDLLVGRVALVLIESAKPPPLAVRKTKVSSFTELKSVRK